MLMSGAYSFLLERIAVCLSFLCGVGLSLDWFPLAGFPVKSVLFSLLLVWILNRVLHVEIVNIMPDHLDTILLLVYFDRKPDVSAFPKGIRIPLVLSATIAKARKRISHVPDHQDTSRWSSSSP